MRFKDVIGQEEIKSKLIQAFADNRVSHSYLLYGTAGVGKMALALAFAQYLSCENKHDGDSCGECPSCRKYENLVHPDLHFVFPVVSTGSSTTKPISDTYLDLWRPMLAESPYFSLSDWQARLQTENKQVQIYAAESADIIKKVSLKTYESKYKAMIVWLPEKMNVDCANKILKVLEEPPQNTVFILVSNNRYDILPTIQSRTQPIKVLGIEEDALQKAIAEKFNLDSETAANVAKISNGSFLEARKHIETDEENSFNFENFKNIMRMTYTAKVPEMLDFAKTFSKLSRERQKGFITYCQTMIRENFISNTTQQVVYLTSDEQDFASKFSRFINNNNIENFISIFNDAFYHIERNANSEILMADTLFNITKIIRK
ncbi:MAG: DNA polymerase III subunit delta [Bacteroidales bacterium]|nr:DNA polymerase III subunit delta [Bacteroidales bacterium]